MEIERLFFVVTPTDLIQTFIETDASIWNVWLQQKPGYIRKTVKRYPSGIVEFLIFWRSAEDLKRASIDPLIPILDFQLRSKFPGSYRRLNNIG